MSTWHIQVPHCRSSPTVQTRLGESLSQITLSGTPCWRLTETTVPKHSINLAIGWLSAPIETTTVELAVKCTFEISFDEP
jgi:hypothetical protein